jgi:CPA2 family monovalent cation:H+ antiporter-2
MDELLAVRRVAIPGSIAGMAAGALGGGLATRAFGWSWSSSLIFGLALAISSTVVLIRVLTEHEALHTKVGQTAVGWLVVEDIVAVVLLVVLPVLAGPGDASPRIVLQGVLLAFAKVGLLLALTVVVGRRVVPRLLVYVAKTRARDLFTLTVLVLALGVAVGASKWFGVSMALGAFLAGLLVGQSPFGARAAADAIPMRDAFAVLFFVSVGTMLDPSQMAKTAPLAVVTLVVVLVAVVTITANPFLYRWACRRPGPRASVMGPSETFHRPKNRSVELCSWGTAPWGARWRSCCSKVKLSPRWSS